MKKIVKLQCSVCARTRGSLIDLKHYATDKCTITLGCEGRLFPVGYTSVGSSVVGIPPVGVTNWTPRATEKLADGTIRPARYAPSTVSISETSLYDTGTGANQQLVLAISDAALGFIPSTSSTVALNLVAEQQQPKDFRQYTYRKSGSFNTVSGVEDGLAKKVLRYDITSATPDVVEVYVNGIKRAAGSGSEDYTLYDGTVGSIVPPNSVRFNSMLTGTVTQIDVIVTKAASLSSLTLQFLRVTDDDSRIGKGAWEGIDAVQNQIDGERFSLFYCDVSELGTLTSDVKLSLDPTVPLIIHDGPSFILDPSAGFLLLSNTKLFTSIDRQRAKRVPLNALVGGTDYLVFTFIDKIKRLLVTESSIADVFPPYVVIRYNAPSLITSGLSGNSDAAQLDNFIINGPDA